MLKIIDWIEKVKWNSDGLVPVIAQQYSTRDVLMLAWMNRESLLATQKTGYAVYWSRSRGELWCKGSTSGHKQKVREIFLDCDNDAILIFIDQEGDIACHTGRHSCFFQKLLTSFDPTISGRLLWGSDYMSHYRSCTNQDQNFMNESILLHLADIIERRKLSSPQASYVASLIEKGENAVLKKIGEEACEVVMAAKDCSKKQLDKDVIAARRKALIGEVADLWFHCLIALSCNEISPNDVLKELENRNGLSGLKEKASRKLVK